MIFQDAFTTTSDTTLASHVPTGAGTSWSLLIDNGATLKAAANPPQDASKPDRCTIGSGGGNQGCLYVADGTYPSENYSVSVYVGRVGTTTSQPIYLAARVVDENNMYAVSFAGTESGKCNANSGQCILYARKSGVWFQLNISFLFFESEDIAKFVVYDTNPVRLKFYKNSTVVFDVTDSTVDRITAVGQAGLGVGALRQLTDDVNVQDIDDFTVEVFPWNVGSGTLTLGGSSTSSTYTPIIKTGTGGLTLGGTATVNSIALAATGSGTLTLGGTSDFKSSLKFIGEGGLILGGTAEPDYFTSIMGSGGLSLGGTSSTTTATRYWISSSTGNWNSASNWALSSGGTGGASVPNSSTNVIFDSGGNGDCIINAAVDIASLTMNIGHTGTVDNNLSPQTILIRGDVNLLAPTGVVNMGSATWTVNGHWTSRNLGILNRNSSTLVMQNTSQKTMAIKTSGGQSLNHLTIDGQVSITATNLELSGNLTIGTGDLLDISTPRVINLNSGSCDLVNNGTITGSGTLMISNNASISVQSGLIDVAILNINEGHDNTSNNGIIGAQYNSAQVNIRNTTTNNRTFNFRNNTIFTGNVLFQLTGNGNYTIDNSSSNANVQFRGNVQMQKIGAGTLSWTKGTGTITLGGSSGTQTIDFNGFTIEDMVINAAGTTKQLNGGFTTDSFTLTAGTINFNGRTIVSSGDFTIGTGGQVVASGLGGSSITVNGNLSLVGESSDRLNLQGTSAWVLIHNGDSNSVSYADVAYSNASGGFSIVASDHNADFGNNSNWLFPIAGTGNLALSGGDQPILIKLPAIGSGGLSLEGEAESEFLAAEGEEFAFMPIGGLILGGDVNSRISASSEQFYAGTGGLVLGGTSDTSLEYIFTTGFTWNVNSEIIISQDFEWNVGQIPLSWYQINGECLEPNALNSGLELSDTGCKSNTYIQIIAARGLADLCNKIKESFMTQKLIWPISSIKRWTRPVRTTDIELLETEGVDLSVNELLPQDFCQVTECLELCLDLDAEIGIIGNFTVQEVFLTATGSGGLSFGGTARVSKTTATGSGTLTLGGTSAFKSTAYQFYGVGGLTLSGDAVEKCTDFRHIASGSLSLTGNPGIVSPQHHYTGVGGLTISSSEFGYDLILRRAGTGGITLGGTVTAAAYWNHFHTGIGGVTLGGNSNYVSDNYVLPATGGLTLSGNSVTTSTYFSYTTSGGLTLSGDAPIGRHYAVTGGFALGGVANAVAKYKFISSGQLIITGDSLVTSPSYFYISVGNLTLGGAGVTNNYDGNSSILGSFEIVELDVQFAEDEETGLDDFAGGTVRTPCGCAAISKMLEIGHNLNRANILNNFLFRNNYTLDSELTLVHTNFGDIWRKNIHYIGSNGSSQERWNLIFEWGCTSEFGGVDLGVNVWKFSFFANRRDLTTGDDFDTRILLAFPFNSVCLPTEVLRFAFTINTQLEEVTISPSSFYVDSFIFQDGIGLFKGKDWMKNPNLIFNISEITPAVSTLRYDIESIIPQEPLLLQ